MIKITKLNTNIQLIFLLAVFFPAFSQDISAQNRVKPVHATWINFTWQDERNKYMNPASVDNTSPALWHLKVKELSSVGIKYLIIMYVANEGKSFYPSSFMNPAYEAGKESPVEAIMNEADARDMKVFMSSGWARNQDDDPSKPEIRAVQSKIMAETAKLFSWHRSFYGWYLPCEDVVGPFLSQKAVDAANEMTAEARKLTPGGRVLISPYGLRMAKFDDGKFLEQISKLKVDIIAYQDEIGCVVEPMPIPHMKDNFRQLRKVHDKTGISFWSNNESFTWEKGLNVRPSALIPAPFPRFLSQLCGASAAGVDEVSSFAICGIYDKPGSEIPVGVPLSSARAWTEYNEWLNREGRWPVLEASFMGTLKNGALGLPLKISNSDTDSNSIGKLTDDKFGTETLADNSWLGFDRKDMIATVDLGTVKEIKSLAARFLSSKQKGVMLPTRVEFAVSDDGKNFREVKTVTMDQYPDDKYDCWIDVAFSGLIEQKGRFVRIWAINGFSQKILSDEVLVNPGF
jgi:hypothetical protein